VRGKKFNQEAPGKGTWQKKKGSPILLLVERKKQRPDVVGCSREEEHPPPTSSEGGKTQYPGAWGTLDVCRDQPFGCVKIVVISHRTHPSQTKRATGGGTNQKEGN